VSPNIAAFSSSTEITAATSANIQTAIGGGVYATAAQGALAGTALQPVTCTWSVSSVTNLTWTGGTGTVAGTCKIVGGITYFNLVITPAGSGSTSTSGTAYATLPAHITPSGMASCSASDGNYPPVVGNGCYIYSNILLLPIWTTDTGAVSVSGWYY
jgi:hypothetical protein